MKFDNGKDFVKNLVSTYCPPPTISNAIRLDTYYKKATNLYNQSIDFLKSGNKPRAYIELMRFSQLVIQLSDHNSFNDKQYSREKSLNKKRLNNAVIKMEELKPQIIQNYDNEIKLEQKKKENQKHNVENKNDENLEDENNNNSIGTNVEDKEQQENQSNVKNVSPTANEIVEEKNEISDNNKKSKNRWGNLVVPSSNIVSPSKSKPKRKPKITNSMDALFNQPLQTPIFIPDCLIAEFIKRAAKNTRDDIETCAVLTGKYNHQQDSYLITHVVIPKQKGSANTVQTLHEEELIVVQEKYGVITLGWIHTHPSQTCFLSSVDMHCQLSYQIMMPNAIAIVHAPKDKTQVFSLTKDGVNFLSKCNCQGFHRHEGTNNIYQIAQHVQFIKGSAKFIDLRK